MVEGNEKGTKVTKIEQVC